MKVRRYGLICMLLVGHEAKAAPAKPAPKPKVWSYRAPEGKEQNVVFIQVKDSILTFTLYGRCTSKQASNARKSENNWDACAKDITAAIYRTLTSKTEFLERQGIAKSLKSLDPKLLSVSPFGECKDDSKNCTLEVPTNLSPNQDISKTYLLAIDKYGVIKYCGSPDITQCLEGNNLRDPQLSTTPNVTPSPNSGR